ncbi:uncharacterized protein LOC133794780 [Humulus lupulus]|uniref:uncharacterized protein LOC133794780 n=1 Tax=Humulus lupulus TaxID=3486 RepID=UPI002B41037D|nr:uncharacterized protein LOC133794780 [Humulus lupulus]
MILDLQKEYAKPYGFKFLRMLQWESTCQPKHSHVKDVLARRRALTIDHRIEGDPPRYAILQDMFQPAPEDGRPYDPEAEADAVAEIAVEAGIFVEDAPTGTALDTSAEPTSAPAPEAYDVVLGEMARLLGRRG